MSDVELVERGKKLFADGQYVNALDCFEQALILRTSDPELWNCKGATLRAMGRYEEASACFNRSLEIDPRDRNAS